MSNSRGTPLFDSMIEQKLLQQNLFCFFMSLNEKEDSELIFGWVDHTKFRGPMIWHEVVH
jgi:hypothetical protein